MKYIVKPEVDQHLNYLEGILKSRGIEDIEKFLNPSKEDLLDYHLLGKIDEGADLLIKHLNSNSKIHLVVDCDNDGNTSAAMFYLYIKDLFPDIQITWSVHRGKEHGVVLDQVPLDTNLVVIPDAGSNQFEEHRALKNLGMEVLVLDHHNVDEKLAYASEDAIIINNQIGGYPNPSLSGAGVVYKFLQCLDERFNIQKADDYLDLSAVGIIGDMMDLRHPETRFIVSYGLAHIKNSGLQALIDKQSFSIKDPTNVTPMDIAFYITPLINAIIRVGSQADKETLFNAFIRGDEYEQSTKRGAKPGDLENIGAKAGRIGGNAKAKQTKMKEKSVEALKVKIANEMLDQNKVLILALNEEEASAVDPNLTGLVAMQILSIYKKPTILLRESETEPGVFKGSMRADSNGAIPNFQDFLKATNCFEYVEGHECAAGAALKEKNIDRFISVSNKSLSGINTSQSSWEVDYEFTEYNMCKIPSLAKCIESLRGVWGQGVPEPKIAIRNIHINDNTIFIMGKTKDSCKISCGDVAIVKFKDLHFIESLKNRSSDYISIVGKVQLNEYMGKITTQVLVDDYEFVNPRTIF